jgi:hypothetical protein
MSDMQLIAFFKKPSTGSVCGGSITINCIGILKFREKASMDEIFFAAYYSCFSFYLESESTRKLRLMGDTTILVDSNKIEKNPNERCSSKPDTNKSKK